MTIFALLLLSSVCGCSGMGQSIVNFLRAGPWWKADQVTNLSQRAQLLEEQGELAMALDHWRLVQHVAMDPSRAKREITRLAKKIDEAVQAHYRSGMEKMKRNERAAARNHFLAALRLNPDFEPARRQIKVNFSPFPLIVYRSVSGDHPATVAKKVFGNADHAFLVTWFNDLPEDAKLPPGTLLMLPKLETAAPSPPRKKQPPDHLKKARARLAADDVEGALDLVKQMNAADPAVQSLTHAIHLKQATEQIEAGLLATARLSLATVPDGFTGKQAAVDALKKQEAAMDLKAAHKLFDGDEYRQSLELAEVVLKQAPENTEARQLADEARYRLARQYADHDRLLEAKALLDHADKNHSASMALVKRVKKRLLELAQRHYRNGVKHFINEDLKAAVSEWEKALIYNPNHEKARENIENARRIMQKIEKWEPDQAK